MNINNLNSLILASSSPRRKNLLRDIGFDFISISPKITEKVFKDPKKTVLDNAYHKAKWVQNRLSKKRAKNVTIVGCDTVVFHKGQILGKPSSKKQALEYLDRLSKSTHIVYSGLVLLSGSKKIKDVVSSKVFFRKITDEEKLAYIKTSEPYDKAGGYAVQGLASLFIQKIEGSYTNVMGLPLESLLLNLEKLTAIPIYQYFS